MRTTSKWVWFGALAWAACACLWVQDGLNYQKRGDRSEGVRSQLVAGFHVDLLSVRVLYDEAIGSFGERMHLRFYLPESVPAHVTVRDIEPSRSYYWLDNVRPRKPRRAGEFNEFDWPTGDVLRHLEALPAAELGALMRLGSGAPSSVERVAPAILYQVKPPAQIQIYEFTFRLREDVKLTAEVFKPGERRALFSRKYERQLGGEALRVEWNAAQGAPGPHRLVLSGYTRDTNETVYQEAVFHHQLQ